MKILKPFTIKGKVYQLMLQAKNTKTDVLVNESEIAKKPESKLTNSTLSAHIAAITKEYFPGHRFCYHTKGSPAQRFILLLEEPDACASKAYRGTSSHAAIGSTSIPIGEDYDAMMTKLGSGR